MLNKLLNKVLIGIASILIFLQIVKLYLLLSLGGVAWEYDKGLVIRTIVTIPLWIGYALFWINRCKKESKG